MWVLEINSVELNTSINLNFAAHILMHESLIAHHLEHFLDRTGAIDDIGVAVRDACCSARQVAAVQDERGQLPGT